MKKSIGYLAIVLGMGLAAFPSSAEAGQQRFYRGNTVYYSSPPITYSTNPGIAVSVGIPGVFQGNYIQGGPTYYANPPVVYYGPPAVYGSGFYPRYSTPYPVYSGPGISFGFSTGRRYWR